MISYKKDLDKIEDEDKNLDLTFGSRYFKENIPKYSLNENGMPAKSVYQLIHDELSLDGNPILNLASFVTDWMEDEADQLIIENLGKNFIDIDEYPQTSQIQDRVVNILANLYHSPEDCESLGMGTIGSSEAIMLGLLAHKWTWRERRKAEGKPITNPNIVMGADVHTVWEKFAKYFDVELRLIPLKEDEYVVNIEDIEKQIDENTICVGAVLGTTFTGEMDPISEINDLLLRIKKEKGWNIPIHVDAASGGFIAPFAYPDMEWDFQLEQVRTINVSGHKYGLVYPGIGWLIFKDKSDLPEDLIFNVNYLGGLMPNYSLNFSKGSGMIIAQYYNLLRLGRKGYTNIVYNMLENTKYLKESLEDTGKFEIINEEILFPLVVVKLKNNEKYSVYDLSKLLRVKGWIVPAYTLPANAEDKEVLRFVIKENFGRNLTNNLISDIKEAISFLETKDIKTKDKVDYTPLY
ncbi:glutamate decarboxylase [Methanobrevibacter sp. UBA46]|jgi:glutamate decarboxylase|uniref:glutamate decarboxylase n=1 Tax=Methanobrevibacter sp. UBA46 TaxID=1915488 RepID=UPI0037588304|nr:glutamate decarboxylase [Methanobacteriaceae archaeon]